VPCIVAGGSALEEFGGDSCRVIDVPVDGEKLAGYVEEAKFAGAPAGVLDWDEVAGRTAKVYGE
jgi:hypothetical protein